MRKKNFAILLFIFIIWRVSLFSVTWLAPYFFTYTPTIYANNLLEFSKTSKTEQRWAQFDGVHYIQIALNGYRSTALVQAFFPLFPILMDELSDFLNIHPVTSGLILSNTFFFMFIVTWFYYVSQRYKEELAWKSVLVLLLFPTSFFFGAIYTESLFLLLTVSAFAAARERKWILTSIFVMGATATRLVGVFLIPALAIDLFFQYHHITRKTSIQEVVHAAFQFLREQWFALVCLTVGLIGIGSYMMYLWINFSDPIYFYHVQSMFGGIREERIITLPQVIWRYIKILSSVSPTNWRYFAYAQEFVLSMCALILLIIGAVQRSYKTKISELTFSFFAFILPTLTGTFSSMPRYILVCFPLFFIIPQILKKRPHFYFYLLLSTFFLILNTMLFLQGNWIA